MEAGEEQRRRSEKGKRKEDGDTCSAAHDATRQTRAYVTGKVETPSILLRQPGQPLSTNSCIRYSGASFQRSHARLPALDAADGTVQDETCFG